MLQLNVLLPQLATMKIVSFFSHTMLHHLWTNLIKSEYVPDVHDSKFFT